MPLHPALDTVQFLIGTWRGEGSGRYPTIAPFDYLEEISFVPGPGKPFLAYSQRTWRAGSNDPLHSESGFLRALGSEEVELVISQPTGIVEVHVGTVRDTTVTLQGSAFTTPTARPVSATTRVIEVAAGTLRYELAMEAVDQPLQHHLSATLTHVAD
ncbi:MAG: FABP family protein [Acidimicrobiia bacterium]